MGRQPIQCRSTEYDEQHRHNQEQRKQNHEHHRHGAEQEPIALALEVMRLVESGQDAIDAARSIEQHEHETDAGNFRVDSVGQQVLDGGFHEAECVPGEILAERVKQAHLEVRHRHQGQQAQQDEDHRENGNEHLEGNRGSPDAQAPSATPTTKKRKTFHALMPSNPHG